MTAAKEARRAEVAKEEADRVAVAAREEERRRSLVRQKKWKRVLYVVFRILHVRNIFGTTGGYLQLFSRLKPKEGRRPRPPDEYNANFAIHFLDA